METWNNNPPFDFFRFLKGCWFLICIEDLKRQMRERDARMLEISARWAKAGRELAEQSLG